MTPAIRIQTIVCLFGAIPLGRTGWIIYIKRNCVAVSLPWIPCRSTKANSFMLSARAWKCSPCPHPHYKFVGVIKILNNHDNYTTDTGKGVAVEYVTQTA